MDFPDLSDEDLIQSFSLQASEISRIEEMALSQPQLPSDNMKTKPVRKRRTRKAETAQEETVGRKPKKEVLDLKQLREWKKSLGKTETQESEEFEEQFLSNPEKKPKIASNLEKHLAALRGQNLRKQRQTNKQKERFEADKQELAQAGKSCYPFESPAPVVLISKSDQEKIEAQQRYLNRMDTSEVSDVVLEYRINGENGGESGRIPCRFGDGKEYVAAFKPAFLVELKANIANSLAQIQPNRSLVFWLRCRQSTETDLYLYSELEKSGVLSGGFKAGDIVLCSTGDLGTEKFLGICVKQHYAGGTELALRCRNRQGNIQDVPMLFNLTYLDSIITHEREYQSLRLIEFFPLKDALLHPSPVPIPSNPTAFPPYFHLNDSQITAVKAALDPSPGFTLIQGPPGTGKTHVLTSLLSLLLQKSTYKLGGILVCAPSNAAIDEIVSRVVTNGLLDSEGNRRNDCKLVRIMGENRPKTQFCKVKRRPEVEKIALDQLIIEKMKELGLLEDFSGIERTKNELNRLEKQLLDADMRQIPELRQQIHHFQLTLSLEKQQKSFLTLKKQQLSNEILHSADLIFTTLSSSACSHLQSLSRNFEYVIIDECCQSTELRALIPLRYNAKKVVLIGDPMQLPAVTFSENKEYGKSLFERLKETGESVVMLKEQYRMVKSIREFPSETFYAGKLVDAGGKKCPDWIPSPELMFVNLKVSREIREEDEKSISNPAETTFICDLYESFRAYHGSGLDIGIITPYKKQVARLKDELKRRFGDVVRRDVEVNTVDGFQGREKDVIIFSAVRSMDQMGFLTDIRRLNVAITRAKFALWMVGKVETLQKNSTWGRLVGHIKDKHVVVHVSSFSEIRAIFRPKVSASMAITEPIGVKKAVERRPIDYAKMFERPVLRAQTPGIMELIAAREAQKAAQMKLSRQI